MPSVGKHTGPRSMSATSVRMHWPIAVCFLSISCIAVVFGQTRQENAPGSNGDENNIAFELPDITVMAHDSDEHTYVVEAFKSVKNDRIFQELRTSPAKFSELSWVSSGHPVFVRSADERNGSNYRLFHQAEDEFYVKIQMLTETHKSMLVESAREKYGLSVTEKQFVLLPLTHFECKLKLYDSNGMKHIISGTVGNFKRIPLRMDFEVPRHTLERDIFSAKLMDDSSRLSFICNMSAGGKLMKTNTLIIESRQMEQIGMSDKLFGTAENVYVTRYQMSELAREMYSTLNIIEDYQMPEHTFSEAFLDGLISQLSSDHFTNVPLDTAIRSLSRYTVDFTRDLQPDVVRRNLSKIFQVVQEGHTAHIIATRENASIDTSHSDWSVSASESVSTLFGGRSIAESYARSNSGSRNSESKTLDDQLKELNKLSGNNIEWKIEGDRVIPKSLNVAKLSKARLSSRLTFSRVQFRAFYAPYSRSLTLYTRDAIASKPHSDVVRELGVVLTHQLSSMSATLQSVMQQQATINRRSAATIEHLLAKSVYVKDSKDAERQIVEGVLGPIRDCADVKARGYTSSGVYTVYAGQSDDSLNAVSVYCDMTTDGGGWTVFQRRQDGTEDFYHNWTDYANGFGCLRREFWLGNDNLYALTRTKQYTLRVDLAHFNGSTRYAEYSNFTVGPRADNYTLLSLGTYRGNAGDSLTGHVGMQFTTRDQDNDEDIKYNCAVYFKGAWWYNNCHYSNLNGFYYRNGEPMSTAGDGVIWQHWTGNQYSLRFTEMKIRPNNV